MTSPLGAEDEAFHPAGDDPHWNESSWFGFSVPERDLNGFFYFFHDVRTGVSGGGPAIWDPTGEEIYDCRFYDWRWIQPPATEPLDHRDFTLPNSLRHEAVDPMKQYRLRYDALGLQLDLTWTALMDPHEIRYSEMDTMIGARHFDQPGRATGSFTLDGERVDVDCYSLRDRTWGPHRPGSSRSGDYLWAINSAEQNWHVITIAGDEPGVDKVMNGYLVRDGKVADLVRGERRVLARKGRAPQRILLEAEDELGRTLRAEGTVRTALRWMGWPGRLAFWTLTDWRWDGLQGWGEDQEFFPREQIRSLPR